MAAPVSGRVLPEWATVAGYEIMEVPAGKARTLTGIILANQDIVEHQISVHLLGSGDSPENKNRIFPGPFILSAEPITAFRGLILLAGDKLVAIADEDDVVSVAASYVEETVA